MRFGCILFFRGTVTDVAVEHEERGASFRFVEDSEGMLDALDVIGVADAQNVPAVSEESRSDVFGERDAGVAFNGDVVVVPDPAKVIEAQVACERGSLRRDAFHHAAVAADGVNVVVEDVEVRFVVAVGEPFLSDGHANTRCDALAERSGGRLDAGDPMIFRMARRAAVELAEARRAAVELAEAPDVVERNGRVPEIFVVSIYGLRLGEMQNRPKQHRGVAVRQDEPVAIGPYRVLRIEVHHPVPNCID